MRTTARDYRDGRLIEIETAGGLIARIEPAVRQPDPAPDDPWVAPAFWDIQMNGRWGVSFSSPDLTVDDVCEIIHAQRSLGTARVCPTLITAQADHLRHGLATIDAACRSDAEVARRVVCVHLEGPFISPLDGYRGAHPLDAVRDPDWELFLSLQKASGGRIGLVTLAPERPGAIDFIGRAVSSGVVVALGHTAAEPAVFHEAALAGAALSTHLGNGIAAELPRHPNPIWEQASIDALSASFIADARHLDLSTLRVLARVKGPDRVILVSDASPLAGLPPGRHGPWEILETGAIVVAGTSYLAGSGDPLETGVRNLIRATGWPLELVLDAATANPARLLGRPEPRLEPGQPDELVFFKASSDEPFALVDRAGLAK